MRLRPHSLRSSLLVSLLAVACGGAPAAPCDESGAANDCWAPDPAAPGPYAVGVTTIELTDEERQEPGGGPRVLKVEVWYPAVAASRHLPRDVYSFTEEAPPDLTATVSGADLDMPEQDAARDAEPERSGAPYPLLTFSHGKNGLRFQTASLMVHLASHGYVVAAPDHTRDTLWELMRGNDPEGQIFDLLVQRPQDLSFLATWLTQDGGDLAGLADIERWGVFGHSFGGTTSIVIASEEGGFTDERVKAFAPITPAAQITGWIGAGTEHKTSPMWLVAAIDDGTLDFAEDQQAAYLQATSERGMVAIHQAGHFSFTDLCQLDLVALQALIPLDVGVVISDGCGPTFAPPEQILGITKHFTTALFNYVLRQSLPAGDQLNAAALPAAWQELAEVSSDGLP